MSAAPPPIDVVMRCRNEMPHARHALAALARQVGVKPRVLFIDCRSTDGSREEAVAAGARIHDLDPSAYIPGAVLNMGMRMTETPLVAFINADAIALHDDALVKLLEPIANDAGACASFGRQLARADADAITKLDHDRTFAASAVTTRWGVFFSMAASAIRRDAWERLPFDEDLRYSEDVDWTTRARMLGCRIHYVPECRFEHSHAYTLAAQWKRRKGEGRADTLIHHLGRPSPWRDMLRPMVGSIVRDVRAGAISPRFIATRVVQAAGHYVGRRESSER